jgi:hypothetical protein
MRRRSAVIGKLVALAALTFGSALVGTETRGLGDSNAGQSQPPGGRLPLEPLGVRGEAVFPYLEGWYANQDGTFTILLGYYNRNAEQILDIPIGPNNRIEPGGPDRGQPTHFLPRRQYGVFSITVPKDFGKQRLTWTLVANGHTSAVSFWLNPPYVVEPFKNLANGNTPPVIRLGGTSEMQGPPRTIAQTLQAKISEPLALAVDVVDKAPTYTPPPSPAAVARGRGRGPAPLVTVTWTKFRGAGSITFSQAKQEFATLEGKATTTATFSEAGEYMVRATVNDSSGDGGGGDQCCWTTALVKVTVQ